MPASSEASFDGVEDGVDPTAEESMSPAEPTTALPIISEVEIHRAILISN